MSELIIALDFANQQEALALAEKLNPNTCILKVGSELFTCSGSTLVKNLIQKGFRIFLDLKFHDIPNTVAHACKAAADMGVWMVNVHASGGLNMMQAAKNALLPYQKEAPLLIAVTILTSMAEEELQNIGIQYHLQDQVIRLAKLAREAQLDGVVCAAWEVPLLKHACGQDFLTVTPGIRLDRNSLDDQVRVMTPAQAVAAGSDYLVVGRPVTRAINPGQVVEDILKSMD